MAIAVSAATSDPLPVSYRFGDGRLWRDVVRADGTVASSSVVWDSSGGTDPGAAYDAAWLRSRTAPSTEAPSKTIRVVDLFSGCGALTLGVAEACRALGYGFESALAVDVLAPALKVHEHNFGGRVFAGSVTDLDAAAVTGDVDLLLGGPPCQGNSDLNNHTRRADPKNDLYFAMARFAKAWRPRHVLIENVPGVVHDRGKVVERTTAALQRLGYTVHGGVLRASDLGVAQRRRRFFLIASLDRDVRPEDVLRVHGVPAERTVGWAVEDLMDRSSDGPFDSAARHSSTNRRRIDYLFDNDLYDLPDEQRPDCHRFKPHSYKAVYGRLNWEEAAPTVTTGFGSTGQGRFVHPRRRRTLTPHEAARLQFIPDFFEFPVEKRGALQTMIGNAVPPKMSYCIALELLR